ncbi:hypothetical protein [Variovorax sp. JS1663]|uniref:hypothetical protein n=1 Tax=Variovorax sp. JS1663 TaxID=1851577 RepID=UPI000B6B8121|nr:hypothetical protein [Variovorax sp. JS1663]OUL99271.1 hypothetical protein A8M77_27525 [Variovorax sp. JS1663]
MRCSPQVVRALVLVAMGWCAPALAPAADGPVGGDAEPWPVPTARDRERSRQAFQRIALVLRHPRCMNCHTGAEFPRQGDTRQRHQQLVVRGDFNQGAPGMPCVGCHLGTNSPDGRVPGAARWQMAPRSMGWEQLKTDRALCEAFVDKSKNGKRDARAIVEHINHDPLVQWAWMPGERQPPAIGREEFHALVRLWARTGAECPRD